MQAMESAILLQNFASLSEGFTQLGARLSQSASALQTSGMLPAKALIDELAASRISFAELCTRGVALAEALAFSPPPKPETIVSLGDLKLLLQTLAQAEEKRNAAKEISRRALATLDRLYALKHREREVFAPLAECQMRATVLRNTIAETPWPNLHPSAEELGRDDNPFVVLLTLVEHGESLEDELCMKLHDIIERTFSRPLAIAAVRGKLTFVADAKPVRETQVSNVPLSPPTSERIGPTTSKRLGSEPSPVNMTASVPSPGVREKQSVPPPVVPSKASERVVELAPVSPPARGLSEASAEKQQFAFAETQTGVMEMKAEPPPPISVAQLRPAAMGEEKISKVPFPPVFVEEPVAMVVEATLNASVPSNEPMPISSVSSKSYFE